MRLRWLLSAMVVIAVLVPAMMITAARIVGPDGGRWVRLVSFTPYALLLYGVALLLLIVAVVAGHGFRRAIAGTLAVLVLPLVAVHLWWASPAYVGQPAASANHGKTFTVLASNLYLGEADPVELGRLAKRTGAEILVLTEITPAALEALREAGLTDAYPHAGGAPAEGGAGTMVLARHELTDVAPLDTTFGGLAVTVSVPGESIRLIAVHAHPPSDDATAWRSDHAVIRRAAAASAGPTVVAGDFNATMDHEQMRELDGRGLADAAEQANSGWQPTFPDPPLIAVDHVLLTADFVATHTDAVSIEGTDHRALVAELAWR